MQHLSIGLAIFLFTATAQAGIVIETARRDAAGAEKSISTTEIEGGQARITATQADGRQSVVIFKDEALHMLDTQKKTFMVMDKSSIEKMGGMMAQMRQQLANLPPEQRAAMENMMKQRGLNMQQTTHTYDAQPIGASEKAAGRTCKVWNITRDGQPWQQVCAVSLDSLPGKGEFQSLTQAMKDLMDKLQETMGREIGSNPLQQDSGVFEKIKGVPFITRRYDNGTLSAEATVIKSWDSKSIPAAEFAIPSDYVQQSMPMQQRPKR